MNRPALNEAAWLEDEIGSLVTCAPELRYLKILGIRALMLEHLRLSRRAGALMLMEVMNLVTPLDQANRDALMELFDEVEKGLAKRGTT